MRNLLLTAAFVALAATTVYGQQRPADRTVRGLQNRIDRVAEGIEPLKAEDLERANVTDEQKREIARLEDGHTLRLRAFQATRNEIERQIGELRNLARDPGNVNTLAPRVEQLESLADPVVQANREFAASVAGTLTIDQVRRAGLMDVLMELFPWSRGEKLQWLLEQPLDMEGRQDLIEAIHESDQALLEKIYALLDRDQLTAFARVLEEGARGGGRRPGVRGPGADGGRPPQQPRLDPMQIAIDRFNLNEQQQGKFREATEVFQQKNREAMQQRNREAMVEAFREYREALEGFLTPEQVEQMQQVLRPGQPGVRGRGEREGGREGEREGGRRPGGER